MKTVTIRICSLLLAIALSVSIIGITVQATDSNEAPASVYEKPDTNVLTDLGQDPEEISVSSKAEFFNKQWYE